VTGREYGGLDRDDAHECDDEQIIAMSDNPEYEEGRVAYTLGKGLDDNPYGEFNEKAEEWDDGWYDARKSRTGRAFQ
jgi:hypothetical protein